MRYVTVIKEMNVLFSGQIMVVSNNSIVIQAFPIYGSRLPQNCTENTLQNITGVEETAPLMFISPLAFQDLLDLMPVNFTMGIPVEHWQMILGQIPLKGNVGHFPSNETSNEVVVGPSLADECEWTVGTNITVEGRKLEVTGILDTKIALLNRCIFMPLKIAQELFNYRDSVNLIIVKPAQGYSPKNVADAIESRMPSVKALTEDERNDTVQPILAQVEIWNIGIQTVVFLMSLILVMTVTIMSVSERRRDFATLDAIGAPLSYVFRIVIVETLLIGVLGGILGIALGSLGALVLASLYSNIPLAQFFPTFYEIIPPLYMLEIFTAVVTVCCIGGIIPAINAARMRVAEVLRAEY
jgi:ABC-type lipoprotein release transport system permease subunit